MSLTGKTNEEKIWNFLTRNGLNAYGAAGLMGNLYAESALNSQNLQGSYERSLGFTDAEYTAAVDSGSYSNFVRDSAGYGLAQWTYWSRKEALLEYVKAAKTSVGNLETQLNFLIKELSESYASVLATLKTCTSVRAASDVVLTKYERPADQSDSAKAKRASYGQKYYDKYAQATNTNTEKEVATMATKITTAAQLAERALDVAKNYKTLYVMGCFGAPMNATNKSRYCTNHVYNKEADRTAMIKAATADTFGFDCVCLIKGLLWGWNGDKFKTYGGATYASNGVPDIGADRMISACKEISTDFSNIEIGEAVWTDGHIGVYIGDGLAVECTPVWDNCVQVTACNCTKSGYNRRTWKKHGKLPYVAYTGKDENVTTEQKNTNTGTASNAGSAASNAGSSLSFKVGDVVQFTGSKHYANAGATSGPTCKPGKANVTAISKGSKHPYHLVRVSGGGSTVYGWVDAADVKKIGAITVGDVVQFAGGAHYKSADASTKSGSPKAGPARVTAINKGAKHPYHVVHTTSASTVYGWVDADKVSK